jgi:WD40 repeat protein
MASEAVGEGREAPKTKIFISYSRKDMAFADRLDAALKGRNFEPLIDRTEIYAFEDWWARIQALIAQADTVIFVLSPNSVGSDVCEKEVAYASSLNKRFAPVVFRRVDDKSVPRTLARLNFIFFDDDALFEGSFDRLCEALQTNIDWIRKHTEFGVHAHRWELAGRPGPSGLMLRPPLLDEAEGWIAWPPRGAPEPTEVTRAYIVASRTAFQQELSARKAEVDRFLVAQSRFLVDRASAAQSGGDFVTALLLSLEALPQPDSRSELQRTRPLIAEAEAALISTITSLLSRKTDPDDFVEFCVFSHDGTMHLTATENEATIYRHFGAKSVVRLTGHSDTILNAAFSHDQKLVATASKDRTVAIWDVKSGTHLVSCLGHTGDVVSVVFMPSKKHLLTLSLDGTGRIWSVEDGSHLTAFEFNVSSTRNCFRVIQEVAPTWDAPGRLSRREMTTDPLIIPTKDEFRFGLRGSKHRALLSPTSEHVLTLDGSTLKLWNGLNGALTTEFSLGGVPIFAEFSPDARLFAAALNDGSVKLIDLETSHGLVLVSDLQAAPLAFSCNGTRLATTDDKKVLVWDISEHRRYGLSGAASNLMATLTTWDLKIDSLAFCQGNHDLIAISGFGSNAFVFERDKVCLQTSRGRKVVDSGPLPDWVSGLRLSSDGRCVVSFSYDNIVHVWHRGSEGDFVHLRALDHGKREREDDVEDVQFSSDGSKLVVTSHRQTSIFDILSGDRKQLIATGGTSAAFVLADQYVLVCDCEYFLPFGPTPRLYHVATGRQCGLFAPGDFRVNDAYIVSAGRHLFAVSDDKAYLYRNIFEAERLVHLAKWSSPRALSEAERQLHSLDIGIPQWCIDQHKPPFTYPENLPEQPDPASPDVYGQFYDSFRKPLISDAVERAVKFLGQGNGQALEIVIKNIFDEYQNRLRQNRTKFRDNDDFTLAGEGFREIVITLNRVGCMELATKLASEYTGPPYDKSGT